MPIIIEDIQYETGFSGTSPNVDDITVSGSNRVVVALLSLLRTGSLTNTAFVLGGVAPVWAREERVDASNDYVTNISVFSSPAVGTLTASASWVGGASSTYSRMALVALSGVDTSNPVAASYQGTYTYTNVRKSSVALGVIGYQAAGLGADQTIIVGNSNGLCWYTDPSAADDGEVTATNTAGQAEQSVLIQPVVKTTGPIIIAERLMEKWQIVNGILQPKYNNGLVTI